MVSALISKACRDTGILLPSSVWVSNVYRRIVDSPGRRGGVDGVTDEVTFDRDKVSLVFLLPVLLLLSFCLRISFCLFSAEARQQRIHLGMW